MTSIFPFLMLCYKGLLGKGEVVFLAEIRLVRRDKGDIGWRDETESWAR